jgi:hypothetical protein
VIRTRGVEGLRTVIGLLSLADRQSCPLIDKACEIAVSYGAYHLKNIRHLIGQKAAKQEQMEFMQEHPVIRSMDVYGDLVRKSLRSPPPSWEAENASVMNPQESAMRSLCLLALAPLMLLALPARLTAEEAQFKPLFDGKTLDGWEGNLQVFRIEDGSIVGGSMQKALPNNEFLCTQKQYGDFELRLKFKLLGGKSANAGVQIRTRRIPNHHEVIGYQADMAEGLWGVLYEEGGRGKLAGPPKEDIGKPGKRGEWSDYRIRCQGNHVQLWINGQQTVDYTEKSPSIPRTGIIGLQIHGGPPSEAWYKDVVIQELSAERK